MDTHMADQGLRSLRKTGLLAIMHEQELEIQRLGDENKLLKLQLENKSIALTNAGSIAEASLQVSNIMNAAQQCADIYLENVRALESSANAVSENARRSAEQMMQEAQSRADAMIREAELRCSEREAQTKLNMEQIWLELQNRIEQLRKSYSDFSEIMGKANLLLSPANDLNDMAVAEWESGGSV